MVGTRLCLHTCTHSHSHTRTHNTHTRSHNTHNIHTCSHTHAHTHTTHTRTVIRTTKCTSHPRPHSSLGFPPSTSRLRIVSNWSSAASFPSTTPSPRHHYQAGRIVQSGTGGQTPFQTNHDKVSAPPVTRVFYIHQPILVIGTSFRTVRPITQY